MRALQALAGLGFFTWFAGCNAILGNESEYTLEGAGTATDMGGGAGDETGGTSGTGGRGGSAGNAGTTNAGRSGSGASGRGGGASTGGRGSGGDSAGTSGSAGESGQSGGETGGAGGEPPVCDPSGVEDCFNGRDDDCNELTDCADPACDESIAQCVPVPDGAELGSMDPPGGCASDSEQLTLYDGLSGPTECEGCTCQPKTSRCDSGIYAYGPYTCGMFQFDGLLHTIFSDSCTQLPADPNIHYYSVRGLSTCDAIGTSVPPPVTWTRTATFCAAEQLGGGCDTGYRCAPASTPASCVLFAGANHDCTADYPTTADGEWYEDYDDDRTCSQCQCSFGSPECVGGTIQIFGDPSCATNPYSVGAAEGSACPLPFTPQSAKIAGTTASNTCPLQVYPSGSFEPTGPRTVCCQ